MTNAETLRDLLDGGEPRTWTRGEFSVEISTYSAAGEWLVMEVRFTRSGVLIFDDRIRRRKPPSMVPDGTTTLYNRYEVIQTLEPRYLTPAEFNALSNAQKNALRLVGTWDRPNLVQNLRQALRDDLDDTVRIVTRGFSEPHLMRGPDGSFRGDTLVVNSSTADGRLLSTSNVSWNTVRNGAGLTAVTNASPQSIDATDAASDTIAGLHFDFDTSLLGASATITAVVLSLCAVGGTFNNAGGGTLECREHNWGPTLATADWPDFDPSTNWTNLAYIGSKTMASWTNTSGVYNDFTQQAGANAWVNKTGVSYCAVYNSLSYGAAAPGTTNTVSAAMANAAGTTTDPKLTITYTAGTAWTQTLSGAISPAGAVTNRMRKSVSGAIDPAGLVVKRALNALAGSLPLAGVVINFARKALAGSIDPAGALATTAPTRQTLVGAITPVGAATNRIGKAVSGAISPTGSITLLARKMLAGAISPAGALAAVERKAMSLGGAITPVGSLVTQLTLGIAYYVTMHLSAREAPDVYLEARHAPDVELMSRDAPDVSLEARDAGQLD